MGRPNQGGVREVKGGWEARATVSKNPPVRRRHTFVEKEDAEAWLAAVKAAADSKLPPPEPFEFETLRQSYESKHEVFQGFAEAAWRAWEEEYRDNPRSGADMTMKAELNLRKWIVPYFVAVSGTFEAITRDHVKDFVLTMSGRKEFITPPVDTNIELSASKRHLSIAETADLLGQSKSSVLRHVAAGKFPNHTRIEGGPERGQIRIPTKDLVASGLNRRPPTSAGRGRILSGVGSGGASVSTQRDILMVLRRILAWARGKGLIAHDPTEAISAMPPLAAVAITKPNKEDPRPFTLRECAAAAEHLIIHYQVVMWIQRIMGLRVSEVYGIRIGSIIDLGTRGAITLVEQGGRSFLVRDENDKIQRVNGKGEMKTKSSRRIVVAPEQVMALIRIYIRAFHMDPDTNEIDPNARLIVGLRDPGKSGGSSYYAALKRSFAITGLSFNDVGFRAGTHHLRKSMSTDVDMLTDISQWLHSSMLGHAPKGHDGGADITRKVYVLKSDRVLEPLVKAAEEIEQMIESERCVLLVPTTRRPQYSKGHYLRQKRWSEHADHVLAEAGATIPRDDKLSPAEAAARLGVPVATLMGWVRDGRIPSERVLAPRSGEPQYLIDPVVLEEHIEMQRSRVTVREAAEELGTFVWPIYRAIDAGRLPSTREGSRIYILRSDLADARSDLLGNAALHARSMSTFEAARVLGVSAASIRALRRRGTLETDPEGLPNSPFLTRASVAAELERRKPGKTRREFDMSKMMTLQEAKEATGLRHNELLQLANEGVMIRRQGYKALFERASLEAWIKSKEN